jgi:uncharacterized membrane protein
MAWFLITLIMPVTGAIVNYIDKYLIERVVENRGIGSLIIFSALMGLPVALLILLFNPNVFSISTRNAFFIMINGFFYVAWVLPYLYALEKDEASVVSPLFQLSPVITFVLGFSFLKESLNMTQLIGCILIFFGAVILSIEKNSSGVKVKIAVLLLMALSCFFIALSGIIFKVVALEESFWITYFWENIGIFISALLLFLVREYRTQFFQALKINRVKVIALNTINETIIMVGEIAIRFATLLAPISLVYFVGEGFQPFFVLAFGILLSIFFPRFISEKIERRKIFQKLLAISVMFVGTYLISF